MAKFKKDNSKENETSDINSELISNDIQMMYAKLLFDEEPSFNDELIEKEMSTKFKSFESSKGDDTKNSRQYVINDFLVQYEDGSIPAQCTIFKPDKQGRLNEDLAKAYRQLWHWEAAKEKTAGCKYELLITDLLSRTLDYKLRVDFFQKFVSAVATALNPTAIFFPWSEKIVDTKAYIENTQTPGRDFLHGLLNVRLFNVENSGLLMDTLGLSALGLPDFQIQFKDFDPGQIAGLLYNYADYIYQNGSVIENENTIVGIEEDSKWECVYKSSFIEPERNVIEIKVK